MQCDLGTKTTAVSAEICALSSHVSSVIFRALNHKLLSQITKFVSYQLKLFFYILLRLPYTVQCLFFICLFLFCHVVAYMFESNIILTALSPSCVHFCIMLCLYTYPGQIQGNSTYLPIYNLTKQTLGINKK